MSISIYPKHWNINQAHKEKKIGIKDQEIKRENSTI